MLEFNTFFNKEEFTNELLRIFDSLSVILFKKNNTLSNIGAIKILSNIDSLSVLCDISDSNNRIRHNLILLLIEACYKAEKISGCSSRLTTFFMIDLIKNIIKTENINLDQHDEIIKVILEQFRFNIQTPSKHLLEKIVLNSVDGDLLISKTVLESVDLAGFEGKIFVDDKTNESNITVELKDGYCFYANPIKAFFDSQENKWDHEKVKILLIDGMIEGVHEIHALLTKSSESKQPMIVVAHGFSEEVIATLKTNQLHGVLNILPVRLNADLESINILNDIAAVCGSSVISSLKGELISLVNYDNLSVIESVVCTDKQILITNNSTKNGVSTHTKNLIDKRENEAALDIKELLDKRIKALSSRTAVIKLQNTVDEKKEIIIENINLALKTVKAVINNGVINRDELIRTLQNLIKEKTGLEKIILTSLSNALKDNPMDYLPALSIVGALKFGGANAFMLLSTHGALMLED